MLFHTAKSAVICYATTENYHEFFSIPSLSFKIEIVASKEPTEAFFKNTFGEG